MKKPVLVLGGGIAGIQASSDLADMGIPVFIVDSAPSIAGRMAQLDKTFPTNDCSACILAPKVTACYNHPLIKTFTWSELLEIKGEAPNFTAVIKKKPRYIDEDACKGCNDCTQACPIEAKNEFDMGLGKRHAIYKPFAQAVPNKVIIDKKGTSPCKYACPAHLDAHGYVALVGQGRHEEALAVIRRTTPFAGVLGRVCLHPCETNCSRQYVESPISIAALKRFAADAEILQGITPKIEVKAELKGKKVAIIGSGPAGLNCAYQLALMGYSVTVFEALPEPGGMLKVGIPDYRLDKKILEREIQIIKDMGVEIKCNTPISKDLTLSDLRKQGYQAFFLGIGAHKDMKLGIPGEDSTAVISSVEFLRKLNLGQPVALGKKVFVVGGGNVAMDAARSALRLGSDVTVLYRRTEEELPANPWEVEHAKEEGVKFEFLTAPVELVQDGKNVLLKCEKNRLGERDASGRRRPVRIAGSEYTIAVDTIITAIGQSVETDPLFAAGLDLFDQKGTIICDDANMRTKEADVFAGGDAVTGPATMIAAVAAGNKAAKSIYNYLEGENIPVEPFLLPETPLEEIAFEGLRKQARANMPMLDMDKRRTTFGEVELGYTAEQAVSEALRCVDCSICCECKACETACQSQAICHNQSEEIIEIDVSSVIWASGFDPSDKIPPELGYASCKDVVTSMEYERILSASGPYEGHVQRPSDGKAPKRIAFIQCVGSRDGQCDRDYCSAVCCMYAVKEAQITKEHLPSVENIDIYYMDIRAYGKDFDKYIDSGKNKYGIKFIRSRVGGVSRDDSTGNLILKYCDEFGGGASEAEYDMVVLSVGLNAKQAIQPLLEKTGVKTDKFGFIWSNEMKAPCTSKEGMLACGVAAGPKDIPETVVEASAAASEAAKVAETCEVDRKNYEEFFIEEPEPVYRDVSKEPIRIGVFICHCGVNIGGYLDVNKVVDYAMTLPFVEFAGQNLYTCSVDAQKVIAEKIKELNLNRVVVASCTPRTHEPLFQSVLSKAGLNPYLFTMANIRDQCSWVHMDYHQDATAKAMDLVKMAVGKVTHAKQLTKQKIEVNKSALVVGGGMAGITAALEIAGMGYKACLVEKSSKLGGSATRLNTTTTGRMVESYIQDFIDDVTNHPLIEVNLNTEIKTIDGYVGNYTTVLTGAGTDRSIKHGVVVVATGAKERRPDEYLYGVDKRVITQMELEETLKGLDQGQDALQFVKKVVMIQCVGSRDEERPYCSRVCCNQAIKNAMTLKELDPEMDVTILYRDVRAYGLYENYYKAARNAGIRFIHYEPAYKPEVVTDKGQLLVQVNEPIQQARITMEADAVILSSAIVPDVEANKKLAQMLKVPMNQDGFFMEAHAKLRPVDFATEGVYLCGLAHAPKNLKECIVQGKAAAARAATVISKDMLETEGTIARVDETLCTGCETCEKVCAYKAITIEDVKLRNGSIVRKSKVNPVLCKGCGTCSVACRCGAIDVNGFSNTQVISEIEYLLRK